MSKNERMNITEFLEARIAEDEALARAAAVGMHGEHKDAWDYGGYVLGAERDSTPKQDEFITAWWPRRVLAECEAKRAIIDHHVCIPDLDGDPAGDTCSVCTEAGPQAQGWPCFTPRALAAVYADHPDYQQEWAV